MGLLTPDRPMAIPMISNYSFSWDIISKETKEKLEARRRRLQFEKYLTELENGVD